jgi:hypothetical protein
MITVLLPILTLLFTLMGIIVGALTVRKLIREMKKPDGEKVVFTPPPVVVDLDAVHRALDAVPNKVLQAVISSSNNLKGNLGELIGYLKLHAAYDRIIPLGNIVDFICIKLPKNGQEGCIDFVDIKTGGSAKLSKDQTQLKKLIEEKKINFVKLKVETSVPEDESST